MPPARARSAEARGPAMTCRSLAEASINFDEEPPSELAPAGARAADAPFPESTLVALWLLGRVPPTALPVPVLRPGRAGRGPGPDVREAVLLAPSGVPVAGDVEVHLRASDFVRHGHAADPAYARVILHLCWVDDLPEAGGWIRLPSPVAEPPAAVASLMPPGQLVATVGAVPLVRSGFAPTVALATHLSAPEVERAVALGPLGTPPCGDQHSGTEPQAGAPEVSERGARVRDEGRRRAAEMAWRAWRLMDRFGPSEALAMLLARAIASSAGRVREDAARRDAVATGIIEGLGADPLRALRVMALAGPPLVGRRALIAAMRIAPRGGDGGDPGGVGRGLGAGRAGEVVWNAVLPLLAATAAAYDDVSLARATAALIEGWPAPAPYGRTRALAAVLDDPVDLAVTGGRRGGALYAQGLLHLQDLWCSRGGCGVCPLSAG